MTDRERLAEVEGRRTQPSEATIGSYWRGPDGRVWQHMTYATQPTASFERVDDREIRRGGVVGSPILEEFVLLVPEVADSGLSPGER